MSKNNQKEYAQKNGFYELGSSEIEVDTPLTEAEKISLGKSQSESLCEIRRLEAELAEIKKEYKNKIETHSIIVGSTADIIKKGFKSITKTLPAFLDTKSNKKNWVDISTGEIIMSRDAREEDKQMSAADIFDDHSKATLDAIAPDDI
jgi:hypothetical protein